MDTFGMHFSSPVGLAAGYDTNGTLIDAMDAMGFGFVEIGAVTPRPQHDHTTPAIHKFKKDHAELAAAYTKTTTTRRFSVR